MKKVGLLIVLSFIYLMNPGLVFASNGWTTYNTSNGLANDYVRSIAVDGSYIWFGTLDGASVVTI